MSKESKYGLIASLVMLILFITLLFVINPILNPLPVNSVVKIKVNDEYEYGWQGSGVFVQDNLIVTAGHVVEGADDMWVVWSNGKKHRPISWYREPKVDLGIIYIETPEIEPTIKFADAKVGKEVLVIGNPYREFPVLTKGIVSAINISREDSFFGEKELILIDAAINPGNSGGPAFNKKGFIVGIVVGGIYGAQGNNFCIPSDIVRLVIDKYFAIKALEGSK